MTTNNDNDNDNNKNDNNNVNDNSVNDNNINDDMKTNEKNKNLLSWEEKQISLSEVSSKIRNGSHIYIGNFAATAQATIGAIVDDVRLLDLNVIQLFPGGELPHLMDKYHHASLSSSSSSVSTTTTPRIRTSAFFAFSQTKSSVREGVADYIPAATSRFPRLLTERNSHISVAIIKVTPPDEDHGFVNLGIGIDVTVDVLKSAVQNRNRNQNGKGKGDLMIIAEVTSHMPWTCGPHSQIPCDLIDWWIWQDEPLGTTRDLFPQFYEPHVPRISDEVNQRIGKQLIKEIPDGATVQMEFSPFSTSVMPYLHQRSDLGIHMDCISDRTMQLILNETVTNAKKAIHTGVTIASIAVGSQELYQWLHRNPLVEFHPISYINDPQVLRQMQNVISIMSGIMVDLTGQVATYSIGFEFYGGQGSTTEALRGAALSPGGKPIVALPSKSAKGYSSIVSALPPGTGVTVTRADVEYVVTEYGTAYLFGKTIRERVLALIHIAHPDFRQDLLEEAKRHHYIPQEQLGQSLLKTLYPEEWECLYTTKAGKQVLVRPVKAIDEDALRDFFHKLSDQSVYMRYFRKVKSLPQRILRKTADIDYSTNMAIVALYPPDAVKGEIIGLGQWIAADRINVAVTGAGEGASGDDEELHHPHHYQFHQQQLHPGQTTPEIAFQIRDDWQGHGLGKYFFSRLVEMARVYPGVTHFKADVLADNKGMNHVFSTMGIPYTKRSDFGVYTYIFDLTAGGGAGVGTSSAMETELLLHGPFAAGPN